MVTVTGWGVVPTYTDTSYFSLSEICCTFGLEALDGGKGYKKSGFMASWGVLSLGRHVERTTETSSFQDQVAGAQLWNTLSLQLCQLNGTRMSVVYQQVRIQKWFWEKNTKLL